MNASTIRESVYRVLASIAPEADLDSLPPEASLRDELDLDSMDFLSFVVGLHKALGVEVPEADYHDLATLAGTVAYLEARTANPG